MWDINHVFGYGNFCQPLSLGLFSSIWTDSQSGLLLSSPPFSTHLVKCLYWWGCWPLPPSPLRILNLLHSHTFCWWDWCNFCPPTPAASIPANQAWHRVSAVGPLQFQSPHHSFHSELLPPTPLLSDDSTIIGLCQWAVVAPKATPPTFTAQPGKPSMNIAHFPTPTNINGGEFCTAVNPYCWAHCFISFILIPLFLQMGSGFQVTQNQWQKNNI